MTDKNMEIYKKYLSSLETNKELKIAIEGLKAVGINFDPEYYEFVNKTKKLLDSIVTELVSLDLEEALAEMTIAAGTIVACIFTIQETKKKQKQENKNSGD